MKDRRTIAAILAAALTLTMCGVSAVADGEADSSAITEHVKNIRAKFRMTGLEPIETVWGIGYRWKG